MNKSSRGIGLAALVLLGSAAHAATQFSSADYSLYPGDFNHDGKSDLLYVAKTPDKPSGIALADASGNPQVGFQSWPSNYLNIPWSSGYTAIVADFNNDQYADVLLQRSTPGNHYLLITNSDPGAGPVGQILGISQTISQTGFSIAWSADQHRLVAGNFDGIGGADLFFQATSLGGTNAVVLSSPGGYFDYTGGGSANCGPEYAGHGPEQCWTDGYKGFKWSTKSALVYAANFGGDGKADLLIQTKPKFVMIDYEIPIPVPTFPPQSFGVLLARANNGSGIFRTLDDVWNWNERGINWSPNNTNLVIGDFSGDGNADIFAQSKSGGGANKLLLANGSATGQIQNATSVASNIAGYAGNSYQLLSGYFGGSGVAVLYAQATTPSGSNFYSGNISSGGGSTYSSPMAIAPGAASAPAPATGVGATNASVDVTSAGTATYGIPLKLPEGTAGMTPKLALQYQHTTGNGLYGVGWGLSGFSIITRCPKTVAQDGATQGVQLTASDEYCLDGNRLRRTLGTQGQSGSQYRTELETYSLIIAQDDGTNGPVSWKVMRKDGKIYEYGATADSRIPVTGTSTTRVWALTRISDRASNYISFTYVNDVANGSYRPNTITYTGNAIQGVAPLYTVQFVDEPRFANENVVHYYGAGLVRQTRRVNRIDVIGAGIVVRQYKLHYEASPTPSQPSRIDWIQECGEDGVCLKETTFDWSDMEMSGGFPVLDANERAALVYSTNTDGAVSYTQIEMNGDGVPDTVMWPASFSMEANSFWVYWGARHGQSAAAPLVMSKLSYNDIAGFVYDWDADGREDLLINRPSHANWWYLHQKNDGSGSLIIEDTGTPISPLGGRTQVIDVDGDGYRDFVYLDGAGSSPPLRVRFHNRNSADGLEPTSSLAWTPPVGTTIPYQAYVDLQINRPRSTITAADVNGDGRQDILLQTNTGWRVLYSNGAGFDTGDLIVSKWDSALQSYFAPTPIDLNGDGCTDLAYPSNTSNPTWQLAISRCRVSSGTGLAPAVNTPHSAALQSGSTGNVVDWNMDGYQDLVYSLPSVPSAAYVAISVGNDIAAPFSIGEFFTVISDRDGDGIPDKVYTPCVAPSNCSPGNYGFNAAVGPKPNLLISAIDGFGNSTRFTYAPLTDETVYMSGTGGGGPNRNVSGPEYVVRKLQSEDGVGGQYSLMYKYDGALSNVQGRGFLGFAHRIITDNRTGIVTEETYDQSITSIGQNWELAGRLIDKKVRQSPSGLLIEWAEYDWNSFGPDGVTNRRYPHVAQQVHRQYELDGSLVSTTTTTSRVDNYGTPYDVSTTTVENGTGIYSGQSSTQRTYTPLASLSSNASPAIWCLGKPNEVQSIRSHSLTHGAQLTRNVSLSWNLEMCRLTDQVVAPGSTWELTTHLEYDAFNNITQTLISGTNVPLRTVETYWGLSGRRPEWSDNALDQRTTFLWSTATGLKRRETDPNQLYTEWSYDEFGRVSRVRHPDGTATTQQYFACVLQNNYCSDSLLRFMVETSERNTSDAVISYSRTYADLLGRPRYEQKLGFDGALASVHTIYDRRGNLASRSNPYFAGSSSYSGSTYSYDLLNRLIQVQRPVSDADASVYTESTSYSGLTVTQTDAQSGNQARVLSAWGDVMRATDRGNQSTSYTYNAFGELRTVTDPLGDVTTFNYNSRGFKESSSDPDMGSSVYTYDALGQVLSQTDALSRVTNVDYDVLGRIRHRTDPGAPQTTWTWDAAPKGIGQLQSVSTPAVYSEEYTYDTAGRRNSAKTNTFGSGEFTIDYTYDASLGALSTITYPTSTGTRFAVQYSYQNGYLKDVRDVSSPATPLWRADAQDATGRVIQETFGNGHQSYLSFDETNGQLNYLQTGPGGGAATQNLRYQWDRLGNLQSRQDANQGLTESFTYDALNRLETARRNGSPTLTMTYDQIGNITSKTEDGTSSAYEYTGSQPGCDYSGLPAQPHAVRKVGAMVYCYDKNGNMVSRGGAIVDWTTYNYPQTIRQPGGNFSTFYYAPDRSRYRQTSLNGSVNEDRVYIGGLFEKLTSGGNTEYRHYIKVNGKTVALHKRSTAGNENFYLHDDHLGSTDVITTQAGAIHVRLSYNAWGRRRGSNWSGAPGAGDIAAINASTHIGFTSQEQLDNLELVHLNGRVYDPVVGRFMSADPFVQNPYRSQSYNRYSYAWNNPLDSTDPTGFECTGSRIASSNCSWANVSVIAGPAYQGEKRERPQRQAEAQNRSAQEGVGLKFVVTSGKTQWFGNDVEADLIDVYDPSVGFIGEYNPATGGFDSAFEGTEASAELLSLLESKFSFGAHVSAGALATLHDARNAVVAVGGGEILGAGMAAALVSRTGANIASYLARLASDGSAGVGGAARGVAGSIRNVNPLRGSTNCVNCAIATDATLAGRPASALAGGPTSISVLERMYGGQFVRASGQSAIEAQLLSAGAGARGIIYGSRGAGEVGHVFNGVNQSGVVRFLDGQTGTIASFDGYSALYFLRTGP